MFHALNPHRLHQSITNKSMLYQESLDIRYYKKTGAYIDIYLVNQGIIHPPGQLKISSSTHISPSPEKTDYNSRKLMREIVQ